MKKTTGVLLFFLYTIASSQIKMEIKILEKNTFSKSLIEVKIINQSDLFYALPLDKTDLKPNFFGKECDFNYKNDFLFIEENNMLPRLSFINNTTKKFEENIYNFPTPQDLSHSEEFLLEYSKKKDSAISKFNFSIENWSKVNNIKNNMRFTKLNYLLYSNILLLKPHQEITYNISIDFLKLYTSRMHETDSYYYYFNLKKDLEYNFMLFYCVDKNVYKYFTKKQQRKLKHYKFFSGNVSSNSLQW